jgi:hypothetical protein
MAISEQYLTTINQKIFNETNGNKYNKRFGDMYNIIKDFMEDNGIMDQQYLNFMVSNENFYSVLTQTFICCLKTFTNSPQQQMISRQYLVNIKNNINVKHETEQPPGFFSGIISSFTSLLSSNENSETKTTENGTYYQVHQVIDKYCDDMNSIDFTNTFKLLNEYVNSNNRYHEEYMFVLTFGVHTFIETISNLQNKRNLLEKFLHNLKELSKLDNKVSLYDEPNYRGNIEF